LICVFCEIKLQYQLIMTMGVDERILFEYSPISLWEEDFSEVRRVLDALRAQGVDDMDA